MSAISENGKVVSLSSTVACDHGSRRVRLTRAARGGWFDPATRAWTELSGGDRRLIGRAMEMAAHRRPVELIELPLGRIAP